MNSKIAVLLLCPFAFYVVACKSLDSDYSGSQDGTSHLSSGKPNAGSEMDQANGRQKFVGKSREELIAMYGKPSTSLKREHNGHRYERVTFSRPWNSLKKSLEEGRPSFEVADAFSLTDGVVTDASVQQGYSR